MTLHQALADLARDHGQDLFRDAAAFRGSLDDYLDEGQASPGTINLLTDAVRLGALDGMLSMVASGAQPRDAVESAGQRLARDRGSADVRGCQWAIAVLGYALGKVPVELIQGLDPDAATAAPPAPPASTPAAPVVSPPHVPVAPATQVTPNQPGSYPAPPHQGPSHPTPYAAAAPWQSASAPAPKKSKAGLIVVAAVLALVLVVGGIVAVVLATGGDDDGGDADGTKTSKTTDDPSDDPSDDKTSDVPDIGGPVIEGLGYRVQMPKGWSDGTEEFLETNPGSETTLDKVLLWGSTFNTARGNVIIETQSSYGNEDPEGLADTWKSALVGTDESAELSDASEISIGGQTALTVTITRVNSSNVDIEQRSHLVINGDKAYSITVSLREGDTDVLDALDEILTTWVWED